MEINCPCLSVFFFSPCRKYICSILKRTWRGAGEKKLKDFAATAVEAEQLLPDAPNLIHINSWPKSRCFHFIVRLRTIWSGTALLQKQHHIKKKVSGCSPVSTCLFVLFFVFLRNRKYKYSCKSLQGALRLLVYVAVVNIFICTYCKLCKYIRLRLYPCRFFYLRSKTKKD